MNEQHPAARRGRDNSRTSLGAGLADLIGPRRAQNPTTTTNPQVVQRLSAASTSAEANNLIYEALTFWAAHHLDDPRHQLAQELANKHQ